MAYVRTRGNQLVIVHGRRDAETGKVVQETLFTLYSQPEAREALKKGRSGVNPRFQGLIEHSNPGISIDWEKIRAGILENIEVLPEDAPDRELLLQEEFSHHLSGCVRQLALADPQHLVVAARLIGESRHELEYLRDLIDWRLKTCEQEENESNQDNDFLWRYQLHGGRIPIGAWEHATNLYERRELDAAESAFTMLTECFSEDADAHNYLGLISMDHDELADAVEEFELAIKLGRRRFPKRIPKNRWWSDHDTRPYMRGLMNMATALNRLGRIDQALACCARLEEECHDDCSAAAHRAPTFLNAFRWEDASRAALHVCCIWPAYSFVAAFAKAEMGELEDSIKWFLHGALNRPRAARMITGLDMEMEMEPDSYHEASDHKDGVHLLKNISRFLDKQSEASATFFETLMGMEQVVAMMDELQHVIQRWHRQHPTPHREAFDRMTEMRTEEYAEARAGELAPVVLRVLGER